MCHNDQPIFTFLSFFSFFLALSNLASLVDRLNSYIELRLFAYVIVEYNDIEKIWILDLARERKEKKSKNRLVINSLWHTVGNH